MTCFRYAVFTMNCAMNRSFHWYVYQSNIAPVLAEKIGNMWTDKILSFNGSQRVKLRRNHATACTIVQRSGYRNKINQGGHPMGLVRIRHSSRDFGWQSSRSVDLAGWQVKMATIEIWIPWRNAYKPHCGGFYTCYAMRTSLIFSDGVMLKFREREENMCLCWCERERGKKRGR